jgi:hypothetical protein
MSRFVYILFCATWKSLEKFAAYFGKNNAPGWPGGVYGFSLLLSLVEAY